MYKEILKLVSNEGLAVVISSLVIVFFYKVGNLGIEYFRKLLFGSMSKTDATKKVLHILDSAPVGFLACDMDRVIKHCNNQMVELCGYTKDQLIGNQIDILIPDKYKKDHSIHMERYSKNPTPRTMNERKNNTVLVSVDNKNIPVKIAIFTEMVGKEKMFMAFVNNK